MEWIVSVVVLAFMLILGVRMMPSKGVKSISTPDLKKIVDAEDKVFVDVRTEAEYKKRHIPQFINIPFGSDFSQLPKDKPIIVICQSGIRSNQACKQLVKQGYTDITNVRRGMNALRGK
ncbi:rhodanese-like domain-containing protein [Solibacillus sp. FSL H8-0538]|uniref:rhodanese-like domain-containing protein n=1 Tax=Solibacillus sp. FSL H8-0538 TaxID=2921400 RepID=UPI0030F66BE5